VLPIWADLSAQECANAGVDWPRSFRTERKDELMKHVELRRRRPILASSA